VYPELRTASVGSSQAPTAAMDNSAEFVNSPQSTINREKFFKQTGPLLYLPPRNFLNGKPSSTLQVHVFRKHVPLGKGPAWRIFV
jgi:hypothetical protein